MISLYLQYLIDKISLDKNHKQIAQPYYQLLFQFDISSILAIINVVTIRIFHKCLNDVSNDDDLEIINSLDCNMQDKQREIITRSDFEKRKLIGRGAFGRVHKATGPNSIQYAMKIIDYTCEEERKVILNEAQSYIEFKHPNIVEGIQFFDDGENEIAIIMEYCEFDLKNIIHNQHNLSVKLRIMINIAEGLQYLHLEKKIAHRDIKPTNILIRDGIAKISDFGISKVINTDDISVTEVKGSKMYMAPQMVNRLRIGLQVDIWALGIVFIQLLLNSTIIELVMDKLPTQMVPFPTNNILSKIQSEPLSQLITFMLHKNPKERPKIKQVLEVLRKVNQIQPQQLISEQINILKQSQTPELIDKNTKRIRELQYQNQCLKLELYLQRQRTQRIKDQAVQIALHAENQIRELKFQLNIALNLNNDLQAQIQSQKNISKLASSLQIKPSMQLNKMHRKKIQISEVGRYDEAGKEIAKINEQCSGLQVRIKVIQIRLSLYAIILLSVFLRQLSRNTKCYVGQLQCELVVINNIMKGKTHLNQWVLMLQMSRINQLIQRNWLNMQLVISIQIRGSCMNFNKFKNKFARAISQSQYLKKLQSLTILIRHNLNDDNSFDQLVKVINSLPIRNFLLIMTKKCEIKQKNWTNKLRIIPRIASEDWA